MTCTFLAPRRSRLSHFGRLVLLVGSVLGGVLGGATGCDVMASADPGLHALLQIEGAQFRPGPFPADEGGPEALAVTTSSTRIELDRLDEPVRAILATGARAAIFGIEGAEGSWIVPAGLPELDTQELPTARATFGVTAELPPGPFVLLAAATDEHGRAGAPARTMLVADEVPPPSGELVIALVWEGAADLDLHVVEPGGGEAWSGKPNTMPVPAPGAPPPAPDEYRKHGILDHDGNKDCRRDGRPSEHVIWSVPPPSGEYIVRVDARSMCGAPIAHWYVAVYRNGVLLDGAAVRGISTQHDVVRPPTPPAEWHGAGAGVLALRFTL